MPGPFDIDPTTPADNQIVSNYPATARAHKTAMAGIVGTNMDEATGYLIPDSGNQTARDALADKTVGQWFFNTTDMVLERWNGTAWVSYGLHGVGDLKCTAYDPTTPPNEWLACDGALYDGSLSVNAALFAKISTNFNTGGETGSQFRVPNLGENVPLGFESGSGFAGTIGLTDGANEVTLTEAELPEYDPNHTHSIEGFNERTGTGLSGGGFTNAWRSKSMGAGPYNQGAEDFASETSVITNYGSASPAAVNLRQPGLVLGWLIKR